MKHLIYLFIGFLLATNVTYSQRIVISGSIHDAATGEPLIGANIFETTKGIGISSNRYGFFSFSTTAETKHLTVSYLGYIPEELTFISTKDTTLDIQLVQMPIELQQVIITSPHEENEVTKPIGMVNLPIAQLKSVPAFLGESDVIKALALTPGVSIGNEGTTGLLVRGGTPDQNLILLDEAKVYNLAHLFGFVSIFNSDALKKVELYKSGFPARFGGRLSSVLDIAMKEGNQERPKREFGIGLIGSRLLVEGPVSKKLLGRSSYMISARTSYVTLFLLPAWISYKFGGTGDFFHYWLYDLNAKINYQFKDGSNVYVSTYTGHDYWNTFDKTTLDRYRFRLNWGNTTLSVRYSKQVAPNLFARSTVSYSTYRYNLGTDNQQKDGKGWQEDQHLNVGSSVQDLTAKLAFDWGAGLSHQVRMGVDLTHYRFRPTHINTSYKINEDSLTKINNTMPAHELAAYIEDEISLTPWFKANIGLRTALYQVQKSNFSALEPRLSMIFKLSPNFSLKAAYNKSHQYVHLLSTNSVGLPNDIWVPSTPTLKPQFAHQTAAGLTYQFLNHSVALSLEAYFKKSFHLIDYSTGTNFLNSFNQSWQSLVQKEGVGESKGIELFVHKSKGSLTGWVSYTLAKSIRKFSTIDSGAWFAGPFDRRHSLNVTGKYVVSPRVSCAATWLFLTGQPTTIPIAVQPNLGNEATAYPIFIYGNRNNYRMPSNHRLDVSVTIHTLTRKGRETNWVFGLYNAYNRANPYYLDFNRRLIRTNQQPTGTDNVVVRKSVFPILPFVSYNIVY